MQTIFFILVLLVFHAYIGYPISLRLIVLVRKKTVRKEAFFPSVTMIVAAHNEEGRIRQKLENTIEQDYPKEKLQVIVASDGSDDRTNDIVKEYEPHGVQLLEINQRRGKENAQKEALGLASGDVVVFSDVATRLDKQGLRTLAANFHDPEIGCVSSKDKVITPEGAVSGENFYVRYEMMLRELESQANSIVGLSGSFFAARKEVCHDFSAEMQSDFRTLLNTIKMGKRGVSDPETYGYYQDIADEKKEFDRKVRTVLRGMTVYFQHAELLNVFRYRLFSYQYFCHKLLRWLVPIFLIMLLVTNACLLFESSVFLLLFVAQVVFYLTAYYGWRSTGKGGNLFVKIPMYFTVVNLSILTAWYKFLRGERLIMWTPSKR